MKKNRIFFLAMLTAIVGMLVFLLIKSDAKDEIHKDEFIFSEEDQKSIDSFNNSLDSFYKQQNFKIGPRVDTSDSR